MQSHHFPQATPDAISQYRLTETSRRGKSHPGAFRGCGWAPHQESGEQRRSKTPAGFVNPLEIGAVQ
jgi:hypothetical protein